MAIWQYDPNNLGRYWHIIVVMITTGCPEPDASPARAALRLVRARVLCQMRAVPNTAHKDFPLPPTAGLSEQQLAIEPLFCTLYMLQTNYAQACYVFLYILRAIVVACSMTIPASNGPGLLARNVTLQPKI